MRKDVKIGEILVKKMKIECGKVFFDFLKSLRFFEFFEFFEVFEFFEFFVAGDSK